MPLWPKLLSGLEGKLWRLRSILNYWRFRVFQQPRHHAVTLGARTRFNVPVRGGCGTLRVGEGTVFGFPAAGRLGSGQINVQTRVREAEIIIGRDVWFNNNVTIAAMQSIQVGDSCRVGDEVVILDCDHHEIKPDRRNEGPGPIKPVKIGRNVWVGSRCMVLKGVTIGENSVIGAMSLVTRDIPPNCVAAGAPAKVIRQIE